MRIIIMMMEAENLLKMVVDLMEVIVRLVYLMVLVFLVKHLIEYIMMDNEIMLSLILVVLLQNRHKKFI
jgi:hypothetical protein